MAPCRYTPSYAIYRCGNIGQAQIDQFDAVSGVTPFALASDIRTRGECGLEHEVGSGVSQHVEAAQHLAAGGDVSRSRWKFSKASLAGNLVGVDVG
jgi:hypothetical protein